MGWAELNNGELLRACAEGEFDAFVTVDRNLRFQQNIARLGVPVLELHAVSNDASELAKLAPSFEAALEQTRTHALVAVHPNGRIEPEVERQLR